MTEAFRFDAAGNMKIICDNCSTAVQAEVHLELLRGDTAKLYDRLGAIHFALVLIIALLSVQIVQNVKRNTVSR